MADINETFEIMIAEMQRYGATPAPSKGGSYNNLLQYRETREKIIDRFLAAFAEGYRLGKEDVEAEPLTIEQLRQMDGQPVWIKQLKDLSVCDTGWALMDTCTDRIRVWWPGSEVEDEPSEENYGKTWVAYDRPPERQEDNNETD